MGQNQSLLEDLEKNTNCKYHLYIFCVIIYFFKELLKK